MVDPALALAIHRIDVAGLMKDGDLLGRIFDTLVVSQLRSQLASCESRPKLFHLRQEKGLHEADVVVEDGGGRVAAIEITATSAPKKADARHLVWLAEELGDRFLVGLVLHTGPRAFRLSDRIVAVPISAVWT